jgi:NAD(P)-dependent dehydrogenase (short-subunit alcohol dehydrogenase family)
MTTQRVIGTLAALTATGVVAAHLLRARRAIGFKGRCVVIFGGSRGLGLVMARELVAEGAHVVLSARDSEELERARASIEGDPSLISVQPCDIRDRAQVSQAIDAIVASHGTIDVLINDAGIIQVGPAEHMTIEDFEDAFATHFWGPLYAIDAALPHMKRRGARRIVNISSIGGKIAVPHLLPYCASKFALTGLSEGLRIELARHGFAVTTVCPGLMRTGSTYNAKFKGQHRLEFAWFHIADSLPSISIDARRAARQIIDACRHGDAELIITPLARLAVRLNGLFPGAMAATSSLAHRFMPGAAPGAGDEIRSGWQSVSGVAPSALTALGDRATAENNELPATDPAPAPSVGGGR